MAFRQSLGPTERSATGGRSGNSRVLVGHASKGSSYQFLVSVTTKRIGEGLRATFSGVLAATDRIGQVIRDYRLSCLYMPVLGAGHGGLKTTEALFAIIVGLAAGARDTGGHHLQRACIVVYQPESKANPEIPRRVIKQILRVALSLGDVS